MSGTLRAMSEERRQFIKRRTNEIAKSIAHGMDASAIVEWFPNGYPNVVNDPLLAAQMAPTLAQIVGSDRAACVAASDGLRRRRLFCAGCANLVFLDRRYPSGN